MLSLLLFSAQFLHAQQNQNTTQQKTILRGLPQNSQGYLIWNNDNPKIKYWVVKIIQKKHDTTFPAGYSERTLKTFEIWDKNYLKLDKSFWNLNITGTLNYAVLEGYDGAYQMQASVTNVLESGYPQLGPPEFVKGFDWQCISGNYAYRIQQYEVIGNSSMGHYSIQPAYYLDDEETGTQMYYDRYLDELGVNNYTNNLAWYEPGGGIIGYKPNGDPIYQTPIPMNPQFHGCGQWSAELYSGGGKFYTFEQYDDNSTVQYHDINGSLITDNKVYALQKYEGWWRYGNIRVPANDEYSINNDCVKTLSWAISQINSPASNLSDIQASHSQYSHFPYHPDNVPDLTCDNFPGTGLGSTGDPFSYWDCVYAAGFFDFIDFNIENAQDATSYWEYLAAVSDCVSDGGSGGFTDGGVTPTEAIANVEYFGLKKYNSDGDSVICSYTHSDLIDAKGNYKQGHNQIITPGLYRMSYKYPTTGLNYIVFENKHRINSTLPLSSFVEATIYPVPLPDEHTFNMNIQTTATSEFLYELLDSQGNKIYSEKFLLPKDHDGVHKIISNKVIPKGILINHFAFSDGSDFSITVNRN